MRNFSSSLAPGDRLLAALAAALLIIGVASPLAFAQQTPYTDVPAGAYYESAAAALLSSGALDSEARLRPGDLATRAEMVKLLVNLNDTLLRYPSTSSFVDVPRDTWYFPYFETAASMGWVNGDRDCYRTGSRPCTARPADRVNRAEAATLLVRMFALQDLNLAPVFSDNAANQWYYNNIQIAADSCVLQGDDFSGNVRPGSSMNRAEMIVMFYRATQNLRYGRDCGVTAPHISSVSAQSATRVRISFSDNLLASSAAVESHYSVRRASDGHLVAIDSATVVNSRTVDLTLHSDLDAATRYTVSVSGLSSSAGVTFSDSAEFTSLGAGVSPALIQTTALSARRVQLHFSADLDETRAEQSSRYDIEKLGGSTTMGIASAVLINSRTVELTLTSDLLSNTAYTVSASSLLTSGGTVFSDTDTFTFQAQAGEISDVAIVASTRIRITFNTELDRSRAENTAFYTVSDGTRLIGINAAHLATDDRMVELTLAESLRSQHSYTVSVAGMLTLQGLTFSDSEIVIFDASTVDLHAVLNGGQETPPVATQMTGTGTFMLNPSGLTYDITVRNVGTGSITGAHFHLGAVGVAGPIVMPITLNGTRATGTWTNLSQADRNAILDGRIYVNVHTAAYPNGEIRGQLLQ